LKKEKQGERVKDEQASEERLMGELDRMYRHVAYLESNKTTVEHDDNPYEYEQLPDPVADAHAKVIPFPGHKIHLPSEEPSEEEPELERKFSYRTHLIVASSFLIFLAFILIMSPVRVMIVPRGSEKGASHQLAVPPSTISTPPIQRKEDVLQTVDEIGQKVDIVPQQTLNPISPFAQKRYYSIQVGAFRKRENASELIDALQKKHIEAYWIEMDSKSRGVIYTVFSGYFMDRKEAAKFMDDKDILDDYPDSFVREISF
jgi:hypothetical protein